MGVRLRTDTSRQTPVDKFQRQRSVRKERGLYSNDTQSGRMQTLVSKAHSLQKPRGKPSHPQPDQNQGQCPEFSPIQSITPWKSQDHCVVIQAAQLFSQPLSGLRLPPWNSALLLAKWLPGPGGPANVLASTFVR